MTHRAGSRTARTGACAGVVLGLLGATGLAAAQPDAGAPPQGATPRQVGAFCTEALPAGKARPKLTESFPERGLAGHAAELRLELEHGKGETVLPDGFQFQLAGDHLAALEEAGFVLPDPDGLAGPTIERSATGEAARTVVVLRFVPLPKTPGRHALVLPALPIAISRASGELMTVCTTPHPITVDEPIANATDPKPQPNPPPQRQLEPWTALRNLVYAALVALVVGALLGWFLVQWLRRPRRAPPAPPPRVPWEVALEELHDIRHAGLVAASRLDEHYDRVSYTVRKYLGDRYGFDGLECTTREIVGVLRRVDPPIPVLESIEHFLREADLVKFAKLSPTNEECVEVLERGELIVRRTVPAIEGGPLVPPAVPPAPPAERAVPASPPGGAP